MSIWEIVLIGAALAMDATAVAITDGMKEPKMRPYKACAIAGAFSLFQAAMPLLGYGLGVLFTAFIGQFAPVVSFCILALLGGKMLFDCILELRAGRGAALHPRPKQIGLLEIGAQAVATSIDALAVGVTLRAAEGNGLPLTFDLCALTIGGVTFVLALAGVLFGRRAGALFAERSGILGGTVLLLIGVKILLEGVL